MSILAKKLSGPSGAADDPNFKNVTLLLNGDGTNGAQNNTFVDSSSNNFTITRNGNTTQGTFSPYGSLWSNYFGGADNYLSVSDNAALQFGSDSFTVECWVFCTANANQGVFQIGSTSWGSGCVFLSMYPNGQFQWGYDSGYTSSGTFPLGAWTHVAIVRTGSNSTKLYVNGVQTGTTNTTALNLTSGNVRIGYYYSSGFEFNGYISNLRIVKGTALYTSNFTPSTTPLTAVSGTSLLTCQSNRFIDNSSNNFTITRNGNTSVQRFSPFNPTAPYSASTIGGSGYFDGTGDYLSAPYSTTAFDWWTSDYTIEAWVYPITLTGWGYLDSGTAQKANLVGNNVYNTSGNYWSFGPYLDGTVKLTYYNGTSVQVTSSVTVKVGQWNHIAMTKTSSGICIFVNGVGTTAVAVSGTPQSGTAVPLTIGAGNNSYINGYVSNLRIVKGTAIYSGTSYTVPTAPLTAITNTSLLCNFTNAGIPDAAMINNLETVGNAQVSTSVKKYGTGSLAFDGNGDYLTIPNTPPVALGTGNFTIEFWCNLTAYSSPNGCVVRIGNETLSSGLFIGYVSTAGVFAYGNNVVITTTGAGFISTGTWQHIAVVRNSGSIQIYVDGVARGTAASYTQNITPTINSYVGGYPSAQYLNGYIDDLRITKGYARYPTEPFPTAALPLY